MLCGGIMETEIKNLRILERKAYRGCLHSIYRFYVAWNCLNEIDYDYSVTKILKFFLNHYNPIECMKVIAECENINHQYSLRFEYLYMHTILAASHLDGREYEAGVVWAKRALDMVDVVFSNYNSATRTRIKKELSATRMYEEHLEYFDQDVYDEFVHQWEINDVLKLQTIKANDNHKSK